MRNCQPGAYYAGAGRRVAEAVLRHISVSDHPTTDIRETCTYDSAGIVISGLGMTSLSSGFLGVCSVQPVDGRNDRSVHTAQLRPAQKLHVV